MPFKLQAAKALIKSASLGLWTLVLLLPSWALAQEAEAPKAEVDAPTGAGTHLFNVALGLVLIVILILVLAWFLRRFGQGGGFNSKSMRILATLPLGARERLLVVDVGGQQILLGVTPSEITSLHVFETPVIDPDQPGGSSEFSQKLMSILQKKDRGGES